MSWNNGYESYKFKKNAEKTKKYLSENGMNNEQIEAMIAYDKRNHLNERNQKRYADEVSFYTTNEEGNEVTIYNDELLYYEDFISAPFEYGFDNPRLEKIWNSLTDPRDKVIFKALSDGYTQEEISKEFKIPQRTISYRINKMRKFQKGC
jgi:DNA-directed RNA polymerase specialized sigma24 family protein